MNVLNDLIKIKANKQDDDLLKLLDEIPVYEKLSADEKLRDLRNSAVTRAKCPMLAKFIDGNMYETILADLAANVYLQIEGVIPAVLQAGEGKSFRQKKQMDVLKTGIARVEYCELTEYDHEEMQGLLAAVFTKKCEDATLAVLIVKTPNGYTMYHGTYSEPDNASVQKNVYKPLVVKGERGTLTMDSYSVLGNNGYPFARYSMSQMMYEVMIGPDGILYLMDSGQTMAAYPIPWEGHNELNMAKKDPELFASMVVSIVESVV